MSKKRGTSENGFEEFGGYMAAKKSKLNAQFNEADSSGAQSLIFSGVSIHINGYVNPTNVRQIFLDHGGKYDSYPSAATTFVVAENLSEATKRKYGSKCIRPAWIVESIAANQKLDHRPFLLYNLNEEKNQKTLTQVVGAVNAASKNPLVKAVQVTTTTTVEPVKNVEPSHNFQGRDEKQQSETNYTENSSGAQVKHAEAQQRIGNSKNAKISKVINSEIDELVDVENLSDSEIELNGNTTTKKSVVEQSSEDASTSSVSGDKIDLSVFASLPDDIAREVASFYGISKDQTNLLPKLPNGNAAGRSIEQVKEPIASTSKTVLPNNQNGPQENNKNELNPYDYMSQLDRNFLQALPKNIRQELELDFAHVKLQQRLPAQQQGKDKPNKMSKTKVTNPDKPKTETVVRVDSVQSPKKDTANTKPEKIIVKQVEPPEKAVYRVVQKLPGETGENDPSYRRVNWWHFDHRDELPTDRDVGYVLIKSKNVPSPILLPALNGETDITKIRNLIRDGIVQLPNPCSDDVNPLMEYFKQLISARFLRQTVILLKFLKRMENNPETNTCWRKIFHHIVLNTQKRCRKIFGCPVELDD